MNIVITTQGQSLDSRVNPRFGRASWFILYNTEDESWQAFENPAETQRGGAGIAAAQFLADKGVETAISGRFGPNAHQALSAAGIKMVMFEDKEQTAREVIDDFLAERLSKPA